MRVRAFRSSHVSDEAGSQGWGDSASRSGEIQTSVIIIAASSSGIDLLVNEIGSYDGTKAIDTPAILDIDADGNWTITPS